MSEALIRLVRFCGICRNLAEAKRVHAQILNTAIPLHRYLANLVIQMYGRCGSPDDAKRVFNSIQEPNHFSWQLLLVAYAQNGHPMLAKRTFDQMPQRSIASWTSLLSALSQEHRSTSPGAVFDKMPARTYVAWNILLLHSMHIESAMKTFETMPERSLESWNSFVVAACSCCSLLRAKQAFDRMPQQNSLSWNPILHAYATHGELQTAKLIFDQLPQRTSLTWTALLAGYVLRADVFLAEALELFRKMPRVDEKSSTSMVKAFAEQGRVDEACRVFDGIPATCRDLVSWSSMFSALAQAGRSWKAMKMFHLMLLDGVPADAHCLTSLLLACRHPGLLDESIELLLTMMDDHGVEPEVEHYCCLADVLGKLGRIEDAEKLLDGMPFLPNAVAWASLLASCQTFQDTSRADRAARELVKLGEDSVVHVLLASLYSGSNGAFEALHVQQGLTT